MANEITVTVANVRPLFGAKVRRLTAGGALAFGDAVYIDASAELQKCDGTDLAKALCVGLVVAPQADTMGATSIADGDVCDVVTSGPVTGYSGMTPGLHVWVSDTVGRLSSAVGTKSCVIGYAESATVVYVRLGEFVVST